MGKEIIRPSNDPQRDVAGLDLLRELANYPHRSVVMHKHQSRHSSTIIQRDALGRVTGSVERIDESEIIDLDGQWVD